MARIFEPYVTTKPKAPGWARDREEDRRRAPRRVAIENRPSRGRLGERAAAARQGGIAPWRRSWSSTTKSASASCSRRSSPTRATRCCSPRAPATRAACASAQRPDLVLLDIWMPDTDGITLLKEWAASGQLDDAGGDDVGPRHDRDRGRGDAHRRARFPREADRAAAAARHGQARAAQPGGRGAARSSRSPRSGARPALAEPRSASRSSPQAGAPLLLRGERGMRAGAVRAPARRAGRAVPRRRRAARGAAFGAAGARRRAASCSSPDLSRLGRAEQQNLEFLLARAEKHKVRVVSFSPLDARSAGREARVRRRSSRRGSAS